MKLEAGWILINLVFSNEENILKLIEGPDN